MVRNATVVLLGLSCLSVQGCSHLTTTAGVCFVDITRGDFTFGEWSERLVTMTPQGEVPARGGVT